VATATTLIRAGLADLVASNGTIVIGTVRSAHRTGMRSGRSSPDVRIAVTDVLKAIEGTDPRPRSWGERSMI